MSTSDAERRRMAAAQEAARLLVEEQAAGGTRSERGEQVDWMLESAVNVEEMLQAARMQDALSGFSRWNEVQPIDRADTTVVPFARNPGLAPTVAAPLRSRGSKALALAASVSVLAVVVTFLFSAYDRTVIRTQLGEHRELTLADGSVLSMAPDSEIRVRLMDSERRIDLDHGDAFFHVAKNPKRPFVVYTGNARIRAVGTAFGVQSDAGSVVVSVAEGRVAVTGAGPAVGKGAGGAAPTAVSLGANEQLTVSVKGGTGRIRKIDSNAVVAWASGQVIVEDEAVGLVVQRFNRYNRTRIVINDPGLAQRRISGLFKVTEPESFVALISSMTGATVSRPADEVIVLGSPAADPTASQSD